MARKDRRNWPPPRVTKPGTFSKPVCFFARDQKAIRRLKRQKRHGDLAKLTHAPGIRYFPDRPVLIPPRPVNRDGRSKSFIRFYERLAKEEPDRLITAPIDEDAGLTAAQAERLLGWKPRSLHRCLTGELPIPGELLEDLAKLCGVRFHWLALNQTPFDVRKRVAMACSAARAKGLSAADVRQLRRTLLIMENPRT